jgi:hypothetical protein
MKKGKRKPRISMAKCRDRVQWLEAKLKREIRPGDLVKDATNPNTPYHRWFTWNREKGFQKNLLYEARQLLGRLTVIYRDLSGNEVSVRKYVHLALEAPATHKLTGTYIERGRAMKNAGLHQQMVESAVQQLEIFKKHFRTFKRVEICFHKIDEAIGILKRARFKKVAGR